MRRAKSTKATTKRRFRPAPSELALIRCMDALRDIDEDMGILAEALEEHTDLTGAVGCLIRLGNRVREVGENLGAFHKPLQQKHIEVLEEARRGQGGKLVALRGAS
jgi:hypothetical protein